MNTQPISILLVEDSPEDVDLTRDALKDSKLKVDLSVVNDGVEAIKYLYKEQQYSHVQRPDLILLDLNLPKKGGIEVLADIKMNEDLKDIPVVILTTSRAESDVLRSYKHHANAYICKPLNLEKFVEVVQAIENFWFTIVKLPHLQGAAQ